MTLPQPDAALLHRLGFAPEDAAGLLAARPEADRAEVALERARALAAAVGTTGAFRFVFRRVDPDLDDLPQRTTLERAVVAHLRAGAHWRCPTGRLALTAGG